MRTNEERIILLHEKAGRLADVSAMRMHGFLSLFLFAVVLQILRKSDFLFQTAQENGFAGSSLLNENAGAYVLVAVVSFAAAVCITVYCLRRRKNKGE